MASARTIFVPDDYAKIQWAVDNASTGDTIIVRDGIYVENIDINKRLTIKSENGSAYCIVRAANKSDHVFEITANYVAISGFTVKESESGAGIYINESDFCVITNNYCSDNYHSGIYLRNSKSSEITNNTCSDNGDGIDLEDSSGNEITNNICSHNDDGIDLESSKGNEITNNICSHNTEGIDIYRSDNNEITNNTCSDNSWDGISLYASDGNKITNNICSYNGWRGISFSKSYHNKITNNTFSYNDRGIYTVRSFHNLIYLNNFINNIESGGFSPPSSNRWYSPGKITYTYRGKTYTNYTGNYWSDYTGSDKNGDGIGDEIYYICADHDDFPLMEPWENYFPKNKPPIASFTYTPENPVVNQSITFDASSSYDPDGTIVSYEWDFDDGNTAMGKIVNHVYSSADEYTVTLTVTDNSSAKNSTSKVVTVIPEVEFFDTGPGTYPSIFGTHKCTIKTNKTIIAEKLYTYPCAGTGGHTEYALICNSTWCAYAEWEGYKGDWKNITFNTTVVLMPYETYNFTIITGSYPQIHHRKTLPTESGWINCTEFTDANGGEYNDWIPAIRLFRI